MVEENQTVKRISYDRAIYLFLSVYRFFAYALAVLIIQVIPLGTDSAPDLETYIILGAVGVYTLLKVFARFRWSHNDPVTFIVLGGDALICVLLLMFTGGLNSGYLLYAITPIVTAALLFEINVALIIAALPALSLLLAHAVLSHWTTRYVWIMQGNYLPVLIVYIGFCFLIATVTYRTNLNIRRRIETRAILEERRRIRRELHDDIAQTLSYLNLKAGMLRESIKSQNTEKALIAIDDIQEVVKDTYEDVRESIDTFSESKILPLVPTLTTYVREFGEKNDIKADFSSPRNLPKLSPLGVLQLLRIAHEALTNVRRHASAANVWVKLINTQQGVEMIVKDDGEGFSYPDCPEDFTGRHGLSIMKERAEGLGGVCTITTSSGQGTEIKVSLPGERVRF